MEPNPVPGKLAAERTMDKKITKVIYNESFGHGRDDRLAELERLISQQEKRTGNYRGKPKGAVCKYRYGFTALDRMEAERANLAFVSNRDVLARRNNAPRGRRQVDSKNPTKGL